jgi:hypothetical protein
MTHRWFTLCLAGLGCFQLARADTIVLRNGEHVEGQIMSETANDVSIRRAFKSGNIKYVDKISRADILRIERAATQPADAAPAAPPATQPSAAEPALPAGKIADKPAFLDAAIKKFAKPDYNTAGMDLSRLIISSTPEELDRFSAAVQDKLGISLAELAATAHFQGTLDRAKGRAVQFPSYVTEYEKPALIPMIKDAYEKTIDAEVSAPGGDDDKDKAERGEHRDRPQAGTGTGARPTEGSGNSADTRRTRRTREDRRRSRNGSSTSRRGSRERDAEEGDDEKEGKEKEGKEDEHEPTSRPSMTIRGWMDKRAGFDGNRRESLALSVQIYHAKSLLAERIRLDPQLKTDVDLKAQLAVERGKLDALLKAVKARAGGALTPSEREAQEAEYRNRIDAAQRDAWRQREMAWGDLRRIMEEQERQRQLMPAPGARPAPAPTPRQ